MSSQRTAQYHWGSIPQLPTQQDTVRPLPAQLSHAGSQHQLPAVKQEAEGSVAQASCLSKQAGTIAAQHQPQKSQASCASLRKPHLPPTASGVSFWSICHLVKGKFGDCLHVWTGSCWAEVGMLVKADCLMQHGHYGKWSCNNTPVTLQQSPVSLILRLFYFAVLQLVPCHSRRQYVCHTDIQPDMQLTADDIAKTLTQLCEIGNTDRASARAALKRAIQENTRGKEAISNRAAEILLLG